MGRLWVFTSLLMIPMYFFDHGLAWIPSYAPANYFLVGFPPPNGSIVDVFAAVFDPAPWYIIGFEILGIFLFGVFWLPWAIARKIETGRMADGTPQSARAMARR